MYVSRPRSTEGGQPHTLCAVYLLKIAVSLECIRRHHTSPLRHGKRTSRFTEYSSIRERVDGRSDRVWTSRSKSHDRTMLRDNATVDNASTGMWERGTIAKRQGGRAVASSVQTLRPVALSHVVSYNELLPLESSETCWTLSHLAH